MKRRGGVAGILFVALFVGAAVMEPHLDLTQADYARRLQSLYAGSTNQARSSLSFSLGILAVLSFILFLGSLWDALREVGGGQDRPSAAIIAAGSAFATLFRGRVGDRWRGWVCPARGPDLQAGRRLLLAPGLVGHPLARRGPGRRRERWRRRLPRRSARPSPPGFPRSGIWCPCSPSRPWCSCGLPRWA